MPVTNLADLLDALKSLHLLEPAQLAKLQEQKAKLPEPQALAKELVKRGWLTLFQGKMLFAGKGAELLLGSYVLLDRLGEGGMGEVFKARNWKMGGLVALKIIRKEKLQNDNSVKRFHREIKSAASLAHPNIVRAIDADQVGTTHLFAMEYVEGSDLAKLVKQNGPLPVWQACEYMRQAALGLQHAHEKGMVHRDIKPHNLLVSTEGVVKLLDLGLARMADTDENTTTLTMEGSVLGTLDYLSPEQALNARKADIRSDLYSLGCTFYYLLTGQVPFPGGSATEKLLKHRLEEPEPVEKLRPEVPAAVAAVVRKLMAREPAARYQTPAELAAALPGGVGRGPNGTGQPLSAGSLTEVAPTLGGAGPDTLKGGRSTLFGTKGSKQRQLLLGIGGGATLALLSVCCLGIVLSGGSKPGAEETHRLAGKAVTAAKPAAKEPRYVKKETIEATIIATLEASGLPALVGRWHALGCFDNILGGGFQTPYPPEKEKVDLSKTYKGKRNEEIGWKEFADFRPGSPVTVNLQPNAQWSTVYLYHEFEVAEAVEIFLMAVGRDAVRIWLNDEQVFEHSYFTPFKLDPQKTVPLKCKAGKNRLLVKVANGAGEPGLILMPLWPAKLKHLFGDTLQRDFPKERERERERERPR